MAQSISDSLLYNHVEENTVKLISECLSDFKADISAINLIQEEIINSVTEMLAGQTATEVWDEQDSPFTFEAAQANESIPVAAASVLQASTPVPQATEAIP